MLYNSILLLLSSSLLVTSTPARLNIQSPSTISNLNSLRVPVILGVMSRCPDAILCESVWDKTLTLVGDLVDLNLVYIAKLNETSPVGVTCMHGEGECNGNIQQLCAAKYWKLDIEEKKSPWNDLWNFVQCMNYGPRLEIGDLKTAKNCAAAIGRGDVVTCSEGVEGIELLKESLTNAEELSITKSCTMLINGEQICIHDSTWKSCENGHEPSDFARQVKKSWEEINNGN